MTKTLADALRALHYPLPDVLSSLSSLSVDTRAPTQTSSKEVNDLFPFTSGAPHIVLKQVNASKEVRPLRVGVVFSGGPAAGGHSVISGLFTGIKEIHEESSLFGFLGGPSGIVNQEYIEITTELCAKFHNQGGFDLIGSGRTKIETEEQLQKSLHTASALQLDGLVIIGGDDSNTNAAILAEFFLAHGCKTTVVGVPKTIDGDVQNAEVDISFGFHTACKVYAEMIGNLAKDARSARKYTHFVKLMGRSASHIALECALATQPNMTLIGEEILASNKTLGDITKDIADLITKRKEAGKSYGIILIPEGLIEFIPEMRKLIQEISSLKTPPEGLSPESQHCFNQLPESIQKQMLFERDPHGNVPLSFIETEKLLSCMVEEELKRRGYPHPFYPLHHFFGYEGRCSFPTPFDARYCAALGKVAAALVHQNRTGYMCYIKGLSASPSSWEAGGIPLTSLMHVETRKGKQKPVIAKALVDLKAAPFALFAKKRSSWMIEDAYIAPGPIQFFGDPEIVYEVPHILCAR